MIALCGVLDVTPDALIQKPTGREAPGRRAGGRRVAGAAGTGATPTSSRPTEGRFPRQPPAGSIRGHGLGAVAGLLIRLAAPFLFDVRFPAPGMSPGRSADEVGDRAYLDLACVLTQ